MKSITMLCSLFFYVNVFAQSSDNIQMSKGQICDVNVGRNIGELLNDGETLKVEKFSGEGEAYFVFHVPILNCGIVKVYAGDQWLKIFQLETDNKSYVTTRGARVGMTLEQLRGLYPEVDITYPKTDFKYFSLGFFLPDDEGYFEFNAEILREKCKIDYDSCKNDFQKLTAKKFVTY